MAANADQSDRIDEVLESKDLIDDGIELHAQIHPRLVHEQVAGWHEQMLAPVVVHRILQEDVERLVNHTAACRAPLEAPNAARAWCDTRADSKAEEYISLHGDLFDDFGEGKSAHRRLAAPSKYGSVAWRHWSTAWRLADEGDSDDNRSEDRDTSSDADDQSRFKSGFLHHKENALRASFMHDETDALIAELTVLEDELGSGAGAGAGVGAGARADVEAHAGSRAEGKEGAGARAGW